VLDDLAAGRIRARELERSAVPVTKPPVTWVTTPRSTASPIIARTASRPCRTADYAYRSGRRDSAADHLRAAVVHNAALGADVWVARARAALDALDR
jgi:hypothetical protein